MMYFELSKISFNLLVKFSLSIDLVVVDISGTLKSVIWGLCIV